MEPHVCGRYPDADVTSVMNPLKTSGGREKETDAEAREKS